MNKNICKKNRLAKKSSAFTLSEVLITLMVIGIVAALTIPAIAYSIQKHMWVEAMKKAFSNLSQAANLIKQDNGGTLAGLFDDSDIMMNAFGTKMSFVKTCLYDNEPGVCFHDGTISWHTLHGGQGWSNPTENARAVGADGVLYRFRMQDKDCNDSQFMIHGQNALCGWIMFDANGFEGPNTAGRDIFVATVTSQGLFFDGSVGDTGMYEPDWATFCNPSSTDAYNGDTCGSRVMKEGGMKY